MRRAGLQPRRLRDVRSGGAPAPRALHARRGAPVLPEVLERAEVGSAVLVGHSDGGSIALIHAAVPCPASPVRGLVLEAPHVFVEEVSVRSIAEAADAFRATDLPSRLRAPPRGEPGGGLLGLEPRLARARVPPLEHRGAPPAGAGPGAGGPGAGGSLRHPRAGGVHPAAGGGPGGDPHPRRLRPLPASRPSRRGAGAHGELRGGPHRAPGPALVPPRRAGALPRPMPSPRMGGAREGAAPLPGHGLSRRAAAPPPPPPRPWQRSPRDHA